MRSATRRAFKADDVVAVADRHRGARGLRQLRTALDLYDPGAESPKETWLRLLAIRAGYPRPRTQIPVLSPDGRRWYYLDMGWEDIKLATEYDGEQHRVNPVQYAYDIQRSEDLDFLGWTASESSRRTAQPTSASTRTRMALETAGRSRNFVNSRSPRSFAANT
jgi:very-short-patch-repair endonuclease